MAWNEPGGDNRDPWGNRNDKGPPDLDEVLRKFQSRLSSLFGKGGGSSGGAGGGGGGKMGAMSGSLIAIIVLLVLAYGSFYTIEAPERGVVLRFGEFQRTSTPGLNFLIPWPVERVFKVNVDQNRSHRLASQAMLTQDENIVDIDLAVQYNVKAADEFLFNVRDPDATVQQVSESAIREVVGANDMDFILKEGRENVAEETLLRMQQVLDDYRTGINVTTVNLESAQPPEAVQAAFSDANKAREDKERFINEAEAYSNGVIPSARGDARRFLEEAKAYRTRVVKSAEGESHRFLALLKEYERAPKVTRDRLYLETVESVLSSTSKIMIDVEGGNNIMYLPLEAMLRNQGPATSGAPGSRDTTRFVTSENDTISGFDSDSRSRGSRQ
ncbi:MAG: FtsH protease activity modulator HflK [Gammaproteobacteria bacterium]|nr:FtsH protease activity modulator HflK [Gammaproteobacteria bacterium]